MKTLKYILTLMAVTSGILAPAEAGVTVTVSTCGTGNYNTDGISDQAEINSAIASVNSRGGGIVHLSSGTYTIDDSVIMYDSTTLEGDGWGAVIKLKDHAGWAQNKGLIENKNKNSASAYNSSITLRNFRIDGNRSNQNGEAPGRYYYSLVEMKYIRNMTISGLNAVNNLNDGLKLGAASGITVQNCTIENGGHSCVYFSNVSKASIRNNSFGVRTNSGVRIYNSNHVVISGNRIYGISTGDWGVQVQQYGTGVVDDILIEKNCIYDCPHGGIGLFARTPSAPGKACDVRIVNNLIYHNNDYNGMGQGNGIAINNFNNTVIENNTIFDNLKSGIACNNFYTPAAWHLSTKVRNNIIVKNGMYGLNTSGCDASFEGYCNDLWQNRPGDYSGSVTAAHDISADPLFAAAPVRMDWSSYGLTVDLHLKSITGRFSGAGRVTDPVNSPCLDAGDPSSAYNNESFPNGGRINMGGYGNTAEASMSKK